MVYDKKTGKALGKVSEKTLCKLLKNFAICGEETISEKSRRVLEQLNIGRKNFS
jgi:hypothetical protein